MSSSRPVAVTPPKIVTAIKKDRSPESQRYDELKGKRVALRLLSTAHTHHGILRWVDRYTLGIVWECRTEVPGSVSIVNKAMVVDIQEATTASRDIDFGAGA